MNQMMIEAFCKGLRDFIVASDASQATASLHYCLGFRDAVGLTDLCSLRLYDTMCLMTSSAIDARVFIRNAEPLAGLSPEVRAMMSEAR